MPKIFISYRRSDSSGYAGRIVDRLHAAFGEGNVFMDLDDIKPGVDFTEELQHAVGNCDALIALIGPNWLKATSASGARRIDDAQDFVRQEISAALQRKVRVIPVLVQKAEMPSAADLPGSLAPLAVHQAIELSDSRWDYDVDQLIAALGGRPPAKTGRTQTWALAGGAVAVAALAVAGTLYFRSPAPAPAKAAHAAKRQAPEMQAAEKQNRALQAPAATDISGKWIGGWTAPDGREVKIRFSFEVSGDRLMGSVRYPTGEGGIQEGKIDGDRVLFLTRHTPQFEDKEVTISYAGRIAGDAINLVMQRPDGARRLVVHRQASS